LRGEAASDQKPTSVFAERVALEESCGPVGVEADEHELAVGSDQHLAVLLEVAAHLLALGDDLDVFAGRLHLESAARRQLTRQRIGGTLLKLTGDEEAAVWDSRRRGWQD